MGVIESIIAVCSVLGLGGLGAWIKKHRAGLSKTALLISKELAPNGGDSIKDKVCGMESRMEEVAAMSQTLIALVADVKERVIRLEDIQMGNKNNG